MGLVALCDKAFRRRTIQKLTETYITQSLLEIAKAVEMDPTEANLHELEFEVVDMVRHYAIALPIRAGTDQLPCIIDLFG